LKAVYLRVSTEDQSEKEQLPAILQEFNLFENDFCIYREVVSAWKVDKENKRFELQKLKDDIKLKKILDLYVWDLDRLFRNRAKMVEFVAYCKFYGVSLYSVRQKWLNDFQKLKKELPDNFKFLADNIHDILINIISQSAEEESKKKSDRVRLKVSKDKEGKTISTYGKTWGRKNLSLQVVENVLKYFEEGKSLRWISQNVFYWDKNNNKKNLSLGSVHKIISQNHPKNSSYKDKFINESINEQKKQLEK
jgi:DNA invertase Pin-like site-specific DNA recombinase